MLGTGTFWEKNCLKMLQNEREGLKMLFSLYPEHSEAIFGRKITCFLPRNNGQVSQKKAILTA